MSGLSPDGETAVLNSIVDAAYVSVHASDPGDTGANEISDPTYARQGPSTFTLTGSHPTTASNSTIIQYSVAGANWGAINYFGIWTAVSGGTFLGSGPLDTTKTVYQGDQLRFLTGALTISAQSVAS